MLPTPPSNVVHLQQRPSKAGLVFPPLVGQDEINRLESAQKRCALWRKIRAHSFASSLLCSLFGLAWFGLAFFVLAVVAWIIVWRNSMDKKTAEKLAMQRLQKAVNPPKASRADRLAYPAWLAMLILGAAIIAAIYFGAF